ncbi:MAG: YggS family pyridoxal phosphate-dependent enzyme [Candidatus Eremiobacteraeota bacterium]|nr:YggS family pyridoxal phosphate-dependent enzyme [Candidatus Eremiobacteraeota bacterium]
MKAAERAGRDPGPITLVGISKKVDVDRIKQAYDAGLRNIGENYLQEARAKIPRCPEGITWHFVGHLQKNKVNPVLSLFSMIQSVDSKELLDKISKRGEKIGKVVPVLLEVNIAGEDTKYGLAPGEVRPLLSKVGKLKGAEVVGLMCMPPYSDNPEDSRPFFRKLVKLFHQIERDSFPAWKGIHLSMGMSGDFEVAVEEGATIVRIGRAIFGERK